MDIINHNKGEKHPHIYNLWQHNTTTNLFGIFFIFLDISYLPAAEDLYSSQIITIKKISKDQVN